MTLVVRFGVLDLSFLVLSCLAPLLSRKKSKHTGEAKLAFICFFVQFRVYLTLVCVIVRAQQGERGGTGAVVCWTWFC